MGNFRELFKNADKILLILAAAFAAVSIVMLLSISYDGGIVITRDVIVQAAAYILGFALLFAISTHLSTLLFHTNGFIISGTKNISSTQK